MIMIKVLEKIYRSYFPKQLKNKKKYSQLLKGLNGIEIGGPSEIFTDKGLLPIYYNINNLDGCNFSSNTVWEGNIENGLNYKYDPNGSKKGYQYIAEGSSLPMIEDGKYDFLLSCHNLEHLANPLKTLDEWKRVVKEKGYILIVLPHKDLTFDRNRKVTAMAHLIEDFKTNKQEDDSTHFEEVISLHDLTLDKGISDKNELINRVQNNISNRCVHHHVFNTRLVAEMLNEVSMQIIYLDVMYHNIFILAQKKESEKISNADFISMKNVNYSGKSVYPSDKPV